MHDNQNSATQGDEVTVRGYIVGVHVRCAGRRRKLGEAKVPQLDVAAGVVEDVGRLQVLLQFP